jgi:hypothetical protein
VNGASTNSGLSTNTVLDSTGKVFFGPSAGAVAVTPTTVASVAIHSGGSVNLSDSNPTNHAGRTLLTTSALTFDGLLNAWQGKLDLNGNDLIVKGVGSTGLANITNQLKQGFNAGAGYWNSANGIISTTAANDATHLTTLGSRSGGIAFDSANTTTNDVLIKYTYYGDANLDGSVNGADYAQIDNGFGMHMTGWQNGDFNYDGVVDGSDYSLIDNTFNQITATGASPLAIVASPAALTSVPEPTTLGLLAIGATGLLGRRRRRND